MEAIQAPEMKPASRDQAARAFEACVGLDPQGMETPAGAAMAGECFSCQAGAGLLFCSISFNRDCAWVHAAAGAGQGMTAPALQAIEQQARKRGCSMVGFQTVRAGLVKLAGRGGYRVKRQVGAGFVLVKDLM